MDPEAALKYSVQRLGPRYSEVVEGLIVLSEPMWDHEKVVDQIRDQLREKVRELDCLMGSGDLDLPGSLNWFVPDLAVVPAVLAEGAGALLPEQTLLVVEATSESNAENDRSVKRKRYGQYGAPLYLLLDRQRLEWTLFSEPHALGYAKQDGPHPFGTTIFLPAPFELELNTSRL
ncbi:Uma2 family endonuclease [Nocardia sp. NPDC051832]|uniref:Uma2 family endonuclease n=1 Tax=Nocardia sp. NPDC051832 TaxID=3155673 RepID=UPI003440A284